MNEKVSSMILQKQKSTVAMALSIASDDSLRDDILNAEISRDYYKSLIEKFQKNTLYKNIWIQILDKDLVSLYRSWSDKRGDNLSQIRKDLVRVAHTKEVFYSVSVGKFDLSIKAIVPLFKDSDFVGIIEVISHFNSIAAQLKKSQIDSVVVLKKEYKKHLAFPFTKLFIDNDYYVANFSATKETMEYLKNHGVENYFNNSYKIENGYIIASYELKDADKNIVAYYIMFKKIDTIADTDLDFFMFKGLTLAVIIVMSIAIAVSSILYITNRRQKKYYKKIIDSSTNIVLINDKKVIVGVNKKFFEYFNSYRTLEEFKQHHQCICDFFMQEDGYLQKEMNSLSWIDYLLSNSDRSHKVKLKISDKIYYFSINASMISQEDSRCSIVLSDITIEENYKKKLEQMSVTDALTGIGNRRYFHQKIKEERDRAERYKYKFSLIMFDIDFFKDVNDKYGHDVGDKVLKVYTALISLYLRDSDVFCRIGGEEFMIIVPNTSLEDAQKTAEKLRVAVENHREVVAITMSFGVVEYKKGEEIEFVFKRVDDALYRAKNGGRNMVVTG